MKIRKTVYLEPDINKQAKQYVFFNNITMSALVEKAMEYYLKKKAKNGK
jgi:hypothetical protein